VFTEWNKSELESYLIEITAPAFGSSLSYYDRLPAALVQGQRDCELFGPS
jgi:6-phosphogluconate dehydrogenase